MIRTIWFRSKFEVEILAGDFLHFGPTAESASHHYSPNVSPQKSQEKTGKQWKTLQEFQDSGNGAKHSPQSGFFMKWVRPRSAMKISTKIIEIWYFSLIRFGPCHNLLPSRSPEEKFCPNFSSVSSLWAEKSQRENRKLHRHATENFENSIF